MQPSGKLLSNPNLALAIFGLAAILIISIPAALFFNISEEIELPSSTYPSDQPEVFKVTFPIITGAASYVPDSQDGNATFESVTYNSTLIQDQLQTIVANISQASTALIEINETNNLDFLE